MLEEIADSITPSGIAAAVVGCVAAVIILVMRVREKSPYQRISTAPSEPPSVTPPLSAPPSVDGSPIAPAPVMPSGAPSAAPAVPVATLPEPQSAEVPATVPLPTIPALAPAGAIPAAPASPPKKIAFKAYTPPVDKAGKR